MWAGVYATHAREFFTMSKFHEYPKVETIHNISKSWKRRPSGTAICRKCRSLALLFLRDGIEVDADRT